MSAANFVWVWKIYSQVVQSSWIHLVILIYFSFWQFGFIGKCRFILELTRVKITVLMTQVVERVTLENVEWQDSVSVHRAIVAVNVKYVSIKSVILFPSILFDLVFCFIALWLCVLFGKSICLHISKFFRTRYVGELEIRIWWKFRRCRIDLRLLSYENSHQCFLNTGGRRERSIFISLRFYFRLHYLRVNRRWKCDDIIAFPNANASLRPVPKSQKDDFIGKGRFSWKICPNDFPVAQMETLSWCEKHAGERGTSI